VSGRREISNEIPSCENIREEKGEASMRSNKAS